MSPSPACAGHGSASASAASAETVTVWHVPRVEDYCQTKGLGVARRINSSSFLAGGHSWSTTFFSYGGHNGPFESICFELHLEQRGTDGDVMVRIKYSFLDEVGEPIPSSTRMSDSVCTFSRTGQSSAHSLLIKREDMESSYVKVKDDKFCIRCDVTVIQVTLMSAVVPPSDLHRHLADLLHTGVGADENSKVGGETFAAHKHVTETGWHVLKVEGYSQMKGIGVARRIKSSSFLAGGHSWCITLFPDDGSSQETSQWIRLGLRLENRVTDGDVLVRAKYSFLDEVGEPIPSSTRTCDSLWHFKSTGQSWTFSPSVRREDMESFYVRDGKFFIRCDVTVIHVACHQMSAVVPPSDLHRHLADLLATGLGADVTFEVGDETFAAHKNVLAARSSVFKAEFFGGPVKENIEARAMVRIDGIEPSVFKAMLYFIYTDSLPNIDRGDKLVMAQHLLVAADRYNIERLVSICEFNLCLFIDRSVVVSTLVLAEQHGCKLLKEKCFEFLKSSENYKKVLVGDDLEHLASSCPSLLNDLCAMFGVCGLLQLKQKVSSASPIKLVRFLNL